MNQYSWDQQFSELFDRCCAAFRSGNTDFRTYYTDGDLAFLSAIGYRQREFFDFVEDHCEFDGDPSPGAALLVAAVRRDFFRHIMGGEFSEKTLMPGDLPDREADLGGYAWLPRILAKARAKLRGELDPDIMYGCGGDRHFLSTCDLHPADFLRAVWAAGDDDDKVLAWVQANGEAQG